MIYELLIQDRDNVTKNYSQTAYNVEWTTTRTGGASKLSFTILKTPIANFHEGNRVRFSANGVLIFFGFVFKKEKNRWGEIVVTAYDQLRYLKANESYTFIGKKTGDIIEEIANQFNLEVGEIEDTGYEIPLLIKENKSCFDIISYANQLTIYNTNQIFVFFDDAGKLSLKKASNMIQNIMIGSKSLVTDYTYTTDIDSDTYNQIKLVRPNKETGKGDVYLYFDSYTLGLWGQLQKYELVDEEMNEAQIDEQARIMLQYYNRVLRTLNIDIVGTEELMTLRAGNMIMVRIPDLGDISINQFVLLDTVTHNFDNNLHTINLEARVILAGGV